MDVLEALGGAALVTLAVLIPLGGLLLLAWFAVTRLRQRRRESALTSDLSALPRVACGRRTRRSRP